MCLILGPRLKGQWLLERVLLLTDLQRERADHSVLAHLRLQAGWVWSNTHWAKESVMAKPQVKGQGSVPCSARGHPIVENWAQ